MPIIKIIKQILYTASKLIIRNRVYIVQLCDNILFRVVAVLAVGLWGGGGGGGVHVAEHVHQYASVGRGRWRRQTQQVCRVVHTAVTHRYALKHPVPPHVKFFHHFYLQCKNVFIFLKKQ